MSAVGRFGCRPRARHEDDIPILRAELYDDVVATLCQCGFVVRGLQRLQIETLSDNAAVLRSSAWVMGEFLDEVLLVLLVQVWKPDSQGHVCPDFSRSSDGHLDVNMP